VDKDRNNCTREKNEKPSNFVAPTPYTDQNGLQINARAVKIESTSLASSLERRSLTGPIVVE
jgi:hypothetical protein